MPDPTDSETPTPEDSPLAAMLADMPLAQPDWALFHQTQECWDAIFEICEDARQSIALEQYIFSPDGIGARLLDLLTRKAREGVEVRVLADGFGASQIPNSAGGQALRKAGGEVVMYNGWREVLLHPYGHLHRLHRKTVMADRVRLICGGCCYHDRMTDWRDTMVRIEGAPVPSAVRAMDALWNRVAHPKRPHEPAHSSPAAADDWAYMVSTPYKPARRELYHALIDAMARAEDCITLTTPYLVPDIKFRRTLNAALARGVRVRLVIPAPARNDHPVWNIPAMAFARRLKTRGADIYLYEPAMIHAKIALVDDEWSCVGSSNLDLLSFSLNLENGVVSRSKAFHDALAEQLERDMAASTPL